MVKTDSDTLTTKRICRQVWGHERIIKKAVNDKSGDESEQQYTDCTRVIILINQLKPGLDEFKARHNKDCQRYNSAFDNQLQGKVMHMRRVNAFLQQQSP